jgi:hypothetical protein
MGLFGLLVGAFATHAESTTICSQRVDYTPKFQKESLPPEQRALWGIWEGEALFGIAARWCIGFLIGRIDEKGEPAVIYAYTSATTGINNVAKIGVAPWRGGRYANGVLTLKGEASFELTKTSEDTLEGFIIVDTRRWEAKLKKRKASN